MELGADLNARDAEHSGVTVIDVEKLEQVAFIGHSRGGEAALAASILHGMSVKFEWQFGDLV